jgi:MerR family transcriptional regulator, light-induced transcriptional regulator
VQCGFNAVARDKNTALQNVYKLLRLELSSFSKTPMKSETKRSFDLGAGAADNPGADADTLYAIAAVERDTGIPKDTLRVWERRYGFPRPGRDSFGERAYTRDQLEKLRLIKRLLDAGHRPGKLVDLDPDALARMGEPRELHRRTSGRRAYSAEKRVSLKAYLTLIQSHDVDNLRRQLAQSQMQLGLARFVTDRIAPLSQMAGDASLSDQLEVFAHRAFTESAKRVLYNAIGSMPAPPLHSAPCVLLTTFPQESNGLGILMAEAMLALEACQCVSLGVQTPVFDIAQAASVHRANIVCLSFSESANPGDITGGLEQLRQVLPPTLEIWVCGQCPALVRRPVSGVVVVPALESLADELARWRKTQP